MAYLPAPWLAHWHEVSRALLKRNKRLRERKRRSVPFFLDLLLMFRTRNRYEQPTLKAQIYSKGMVVVRELSYCALPSKKRRRNELDISGCPNELGHYSNQ